MSLRMMIETATLISAHSADVIYDPDALADEALYRYWRNARECHGYWLSRLNPVAGPLAAIPAMLIKGEIPVSREPAVPAAHANNSSPDRSLTSVIQDVFTSEILIRIWTAILTAHDHVQKGKQTEPIARNVLIGQLQIRRYALESMVSNLGDPGTNQTIEDVNQIDAFRRRCERWCDLLIGHLLYQFPVEEFAFDIDRARDFGEQHLQERFKNSEHVIWELVRGGARLAFPDGGERTPKESELTSRLVEGILSGFPRQSFQSWGGLYVPGVTKFSRSSISAEGPVSEEFLKSLPVHRILEKNPVSAPHDSPPGPISRF
ncbi:MAG: hypothetical protein ACKVT0_17820 [Planctomycetaceae bacterium]